MVYPSLGRFAKLQSFIVFAKYPKVAKFRKMLFFANSQSLVQPFFFAMALPLKCCLHSIV